MESPHNNLFSKKVGEKQEQVRITLDTNALLAIAEKKIDVLEEAKKEFGKNAEFVVPETVVSELDSLSGKGKTMKKNCCIAMELLEKKGVKTVQTKARNADDALLELSGQGVFVITSDRELKRRIKKALGEIIELSKGHIKSVDS